MTEPLTKPLPGSGAAERKERKRLRSVQTRKDAKKAKLDEIAAYNALRWTVFQRDGGRDRAFGTPLVFDGSNTFTASQLHHVVYRSHGGTDTTDNTITVSLATHNLIHEGLLKVEGDPDSTVTFTLLDKQRKVLRVWTDTI